MIKVVIFASDVTDRVHAVEELGNGLQAMAEGDLRITLEQPFIPALEALRVDYSASVGRLRYSIQRICVNAASMAQGFQAIRVESDAQARRSESRLRRSK